MYFLSCIVNFFFFFCIIRCQKCVFLSTISTFTTYSDPEEPANCALLVCISREWRARGGIARRTRPAAVVCGLQMASVFHPVPATLAFKTNSRTAGLCFVFALGPSGFCIQKTRREVLWPLDARPSQCPLSCAPVRNRAPEQSWWTRFSKHRGLMSQIHFFRHHVLCCALPRASSH